MAFELGLEHEMQRHHGQGHVVLPGGPVAGLILVQPELLLGLLKHPLNPVALHLAVERLGHPEHRGTRRGVAQAVFHLGAI